MSSIPQNMRNQLDDEKKCLENSLAEIETNPKLKDHIKLIHDAINILVILARDRNHQNDDEMVLRTFGNRLYSSCTSAFSLILSGYYHTASHALRDILETSYHLHFFAENPSEIQPWRNSSKEDRKNKYPPWKLRESLKDLIGEYGVNSEQLRAIDKTYQFYCEYGAHPTFKGNVVLFSKDGQAHWGPFNHSERLEAFLAELGKYTMLAVDGLAKAFKIENFPQKYKSVFNSFVLIGRNWLRKYSTPLDLDELGRLLD